MPTSCEPRWRPHRTSSSSAPRWAAPRWRRDSRRPAFPSSSSSAANGSSLETASARPGRSSWRTVSGPASGGGTGTGSRSIPAISTTSAATRSSTGRPSSVDPATRRSKGEQEKQPTDLLSPEPRHESQRLRPPGYAASGGGEPRQLAARAVGGTRRSGADATQTHLPDLGADRLAAGVRYWRAVGVQRIGAGQSRGMKAGGRVRVACYLATWQVAGHQNRSRVIAKILGPIGPLGDECTKIHACRHHVFIEV